MQNDPATRYPMLARYQDKFVTAAEAVSSIAPGNRVFVGTASATPLSLIQALEQLDSPPPDVQLLYFITQGTMRYENDVPKTRFRHRCFFVGSDIRGATAQGMADYVPISLSQVPQLIENGRIPVDVALIQVSLPDEYGYVSLGVSVDVTSAAVQKARKIIAEINPNMPCTLGDTFLRMDKIDHLVLVENPVIEYQHPTTDAVAEKIARYIASIIDDGSTLQIGIGRIPSETLKYLVNRRDLGVHSDVITDSIIPLIEKGIITGTQKSIHRGKIVASYCFGTRRLYDLIDHNPMFSFHPIEYVSNISLIAQQKRMVSVTQAFAVDLTGQICADQFQGEFYGGVSTQPEFIRGAAYAVGGKPIICLPSTTDDGKTSRIRPLLKEGEGVTVARSDVHYVITEYGIAYLLGKSIRERTLSLIEIAHPEFRPWLLEEAKKLSYLPQAQMLKSAVAYPVGEERTVVLKDGTGVLIRPARASDITGLQDIFYAMNKQDVYTRFFRNMRSLSASEAQFMCNVNYETDMAFLAVAGTRENEKIVGSSCYVGNLSTNTAEIAYMIRSEWQCMGIGRALQERMKEYAKSRGIRGFTGEILAGNTKMIKLAKSACDNVSLKSQGEYFEFTILFD
ncbi:MAG: GNAT family N-acetyltransferase [Deltaproteobacteria bacterium]|nr:GNAT family N-acetyltransferase [Deltaproteobacteria bacterium]